MDTEEKLKLLREAITHHNVQGYIQPLHDEYLSEYPPACAQRVRWLSGFSGSAGVIVALEEKAALFTDGRYTLQAASEVDDTLYQQCNSADISSDKWIAEHSKKGQRIGYDPKLYTPAMLTRMEKAVKGKQIQYVPVANLVDMIWPDRPAEPASELFVHEFAYSGLAAKEKLEKLTKQIVKEGASGMLLTAPDSVCWLLNIRAGDVEHTPLLLAPVLVFTDGTVTLFAQPSRANTSVREHLGDAVTLVNPDELEAVLAGLGKTKTTILADKQRISLWHQQALEGAKIIHCSDPCQKMKSIKNEVELSGIRTAHIRDGVAVTKFLCWLDSKVLTQAITELDVCNKLHEFRAQNSLFHDESFPTISGSGANGAIVHYRADEQSNRVLQEGELFLLDSGGQYPDGTTDITRTIPIGQPLGEHLDRFTRVLRGHISLATARFPKGTNGSQLDVLARQYLWQAGIDYDHGTGHGVGCFLGVHEGPQGISKRASSVALECGMILSNEPGYYKTGEYGIRIENLVAVVESGDGAGGKPYYGFDTLTCVPIDTRLIDTTMLSEDEKNWLNSYHAWVEDALSEHMSEDERVWLSKRCTAI